MGGQRLLTSTEVHMDSGICLELQVVLTCDLQVIDTKIFGSTGITVYILKTCLVMIYSSEDLSGVHD